jgi:DnaJ-class molecular chaperone
MSELYERLGVSRDASTEEIRRAYKDAAKTHHPDRGGDTETFKKIQEAHEILSDDGRRKMYDMTGSTSNEPSGPATTAGGFPFHFMNGMGPFGMPGVAFDMGDIFGSMFGGPKRSQRRGGRGPTKYQDIGLKLSDFYKGTEIKLKFNQARKCLDCKGTGAESTEPCGQCGGQGMKTHMRQIGPGMIAQTRAPCDACEGEGKRTMRVCRGCHGKKLTEREKMLEIKITPGMKEGEKFTFPGECSDNLDFDEPGDVVLTVQRADDANPFVWKDSDLYISKTVSFAESVLGFTVSLDSHPNGQTPRFVWNGGPLVHGAVLEMKGGGMPKVGGGHGNCFIQIQVSPPPTKPWSPEDAARLQSVLGGTAASFEKLPVLDLAFSDSQTSSLLF